VARDRFRRHACVETPEEADAIFITEAWRHVDTAGYARILKSELARRFYAKTFLFSSADCPAYLLPGFYPSVPQTWFDPQHQCGWCYLGPDSRRFEDDPLFAETRPDLLFSFSGAAKNHSSRRSVLALRHPRAEVFDSAAVSAAAWGDAQERYRQQVARSKFVLCPRGKGASSYRLFETLSAGRVPVVISDAWVEPPGLDWRACSVRVAEKEVATIPALLESLEPQWEAMAAQARESYARLFHTDALFNYLGDSLETLQRTRTERSWACRRRHLHSKFVRACEEARLGGAAFARRWAGKTR
jgi:hypothetical protein